VRLSVCCDILLSIISFRMVPQRVAVGTSSDERHFFTTAAAHRRAYLAVSSPSRAPWLIRRACAASPVLVP